MGRVSDAKVRLMDAVLELIWKGSYFATTIDQICEKAGVKKGSFYYFFDSKSELALEAFEEEWPRRRVELDSMFSPTVAPLERFQRYCEYSYQMQAELKARYGSVLGCPVFSLGTEIGTQDEYLALQKKIMEILEYKRKYFESAIRDAHAAGLINAPDAASKSRLLFAYYQGLLTQARIEDNLDILLAAEEGTWELLGVKETEPVSI